EELSEGSVAAAAFASASAAATRQPARTMRASAFIVPLRALHGAYTTQRRARIVSGRDARPRPQTDVPRGLQCRTRLPMGTPAAAGARFSLRPTLEGNHARSRTNPCPHHLLCARGGVARRRRRRA